ncbi:transposase [Metallosphaera javensis (ex Sakai et al. 2022)]|uniref:transposase n=1 Tax=Metallosphaera javensis (ex Sakai et al. 2022) TaxID=2775498 RepID=UPI00258F8BBF|nr:MAG: ISNCY family transposase ISSto10 [Metallosphaera javensis (ex Sakai et al. 2022)]
MRRGKWLRKLKEALRWRRDYLNALRDALRKFRADVVRKLLLAVISERGSLASMAEALGFDYESVLGKLDELADVDLLPPVKLLVGDHPVQVAVDDTFDEKAYARAMPVSRNLAMFFYSRVKGTFIPAIQLLVVTVRDLVTGEVYLVHVDAYVARKVAEMAKAVGQDLNFSTKVDMTLQVLDRLRRELNVQVITFDSWYVNGRTLLSDVVSSLKSSARVVEGDRSVPVGLLPEGEHHVTYLGVPVKLVVLDYKGYGRRYLFSTDLSMSPEEILTAWENRWDVEVVIRELKALGLENGSFRTWSKNLGYVKLISITLNFLLSLRYVLGESLGVVRLSRLLKTLYLEVGDVKKLFSLR